MSKYEGHEYLFELLEKIANARATISGVVEIVISYEIDVVNKIIYLPWAEMRELEKFLDDPETDSEYLKEYSEENWVDIVVYTSPEKPKGKKKKGKK